MRTHKLGFGALLVSASALATAAPALAQDTDDATAENNRRLGVITVSAQRRDQSLTDVPIAVTAFDAESLISTGTADITQLQRQTPNATIEVARGSNSTLIAFIRGVGQQDPLWGFEPGVGLYVDDVFIARPQGAVLDIFDVERIEVLRGPQGTLYGRNTIGGAIKYVTKGLSDEREANITLNYGTFNQIDAIASGSLPLGDSFRVGGAIARYTRDGYGTNLNTGAEHYDKDVFAYRVSAEIDLTDRLQVRLAADRTEDDSNAKHGHRRLPSADRTLGVTADEFDTRAGLGDDNEVNTEGMSLTVEYAPNDVVTLKSITAIRESETFTPIDFDALPQPDFDVPAKYFDEQFSHEFQLLFDTDNVSGIFGIYYLNGEASGDFDVILSSLGLTIYQAGVQEKENLSVFGDVTWDINEKFSLAVGGRWTQDETVADVTRDLYLGLGSTAFDPSNSGIFFLPQTGYENLVRSDERFTPRIALTYNFSDNANVYASYSEGFKAGGFDPRARQDLDPLGLSRQGFGPEFVDSYEIGTKGVYFDGRLSLNAAAFYAEYTDQQIQVQTGADSDGNGTNDTFVSSVFNAGASEYMGFELEGAFLLTDALTLSGNLGVIDAEIKEILTEGVDAGGNPVVNNIADQFVTQNTPEWSGQVALNYTAPIPGGDRGDLSVTGSLAFRDAYNLANIELPGFAPNTNALWPEGAPSLDPDSYALFDLSAIWTAPSGRYSLAIHGKNLTDERYEVAAYNFVTPSQLGVDSVYSSFYGPPRTVYGSLRINF